MKIVLCCIFNEKQFKIRPKEEFDNPDDTKELIDLRYITHCAKVKDAIGAVFDMRQEIIRAEYLNRMKNKLMPETCRHSSIEKDNFDYIPEKLIPADKRKLAELLQKAWHKLEGNYKDFNGETQRASFSKTPMKFRESATPTRRLVTARTTSQMWLPKCESSSEFTLSPRGVKRYVNTKLNEQVARRSMGFKTTISKRIKKDEEYIRKKQLREMENWQDTRIALNEIQHKSIFFNKK